MNQQMEPQDMIFVFAGLHAPEKDMKNKHM